MRSFLLYKFLPYDVCLTDCAVSSQWQDTHHTNLQRTLQPPLQQACKQGRNYREAARRAAMPAAQASKGGQAQAAEWPVMEQEERMAVLFRDLEKVYRKLERQKNPDKITNMMKDVSNKLKECKALLKDFEREARTDGMPAPILAERKKALADELNELIKRKKEIGAFAERSELLEGATGPPQEDNLENMSNQQLMAKGRKEINETGKTLDRIERVAEDTLQVGVSTAQGLHDQTQQLNKIVDDLADIEFNVKKASKVITDITRGLLTDKCIGALLFLAVAGVIVIIVLKVVNPNKKNIASGIDTINNATGIGNLLNQGVSATTGAINSGINSAVNQLPGTDSTGRRLLRETAAQLVQALLTDDTF